MIRAHGGKLVDRLAGKEVKKSLMDRAADLPALVLNRREMSDLVLIANGAMSPLEGFMTRGEYESVIDSMRLPLGLPWSLPVTLSVKNGSPSLPKPPFEAALTDEKGAALGLMEIEEIYPVDKSREAEKVLLTTDDAHPGVQYLKTTGGEYAGGKVTLFEHYIDDRFSRFYLDPKETRILFKTKGLGQRGGLSDTQPHSQGP